MVTYLSRVSQVPQGVYELPVPVRGELASRHHGNPRVLRRSSLRTMLPALKGSKQRTESVILGGVNSHLRPRKSGPCLSTIFGIPQHPLGSPTDFWWSDLMPSL